MHRPAAKTDFPSDKSMKNENDVYKKINLQLITLPTTPNTAIEKKVFMMNFFNQLAKIDRSSRDILQA